jgi:hypothetical protein
MHTPWFIRGYVPASGTANSEGSIVLVRARTLSITVRVTFDGTVNADTTVNLYYSPDGNNWDTTVYTSFIIPFVISTTKQRTRIIDPPEHGYMSVAVVNGSAAGALSSVICWYTIQSWGRTGDVGHGAVYIDTGEEIQKVERHPHGISES